MRRIISACLLILASAATASAQGLTPSVWQSQRGGLLKVLSVDAAGNFTGVFISSPTGPCPGVPYNLVGRVRVLSHVVCLNRWCTRRAPSGHVVPHGRYRSTSRRRRTSSARVDVRTLKVSAVAKVAAQPARLGDRRRASCGCRASTANEIVVVDPSTMKVVETTPRGRRPDRRAAALRAMCGSRRRPVRRSGVCRYFPRGSQRVSGSLPDPRVDDVPDQPLARRDAGRGRATTAAVRARVGDARRASVGRRLVGLGLRDRRPDRRHHRRAARLDRHAPERDRRRGDRALVLRAGAAAQPDRLRGGPVPVGALRPAGVDAVRCRGRRLPRRRRGDRRDRRAHAARADLARALQVGGDPADRAHRRARARRRAPMSASTRTSPPAPSRST